MAEASSTCHECRSTCIIPPFQRVVDPFPNVNDTRRVWQRLECLTCRQAARYPCNLATAQSEKLWMTDIRGETRWELDWSHPHFWVLLGEARRDRERLTLSGDSLAAARERLTTDHERSMTEQKSLTTTLGRSVIRQELLILDLERSSTTLLRGLTTAIERLASASSNTETLDRNADRGASSAHLNRPAPSRMVHKVQCDTGRPSRDAAGVGGGVSRATAATLGEDPGPATNPRFAAGEAIAAHEPTTALGEIDDGATAGQDGPTAGRHGVVMEPQSTMAGLQSSITQASARDEKTTALAAPSVSSRRWTAEPNVDRFRGQPLPSTAVALWPLDLLMKYDSTLDGDLQEFINDVKKLEGELRAEWEARVSSPQDIDLESAWGGIRRREEIRSELLRRWIEERRAKQARRTP